MPLRLAPFSLKHQHASTWQILRFLYIHICAPGEGRRGCRQKIGQPYKVRNVMSDAQAAPLFLAAVREPEGLCLSANVDYDCTGCSERF